MSNVSEMPDQQFTLGGTLRQMRTARGMKLRDVEKAAGVSNAYLSQIETGKIDKPSPNILYKLAELYGASYDALMELAGYVSRRQNEKPRLLTGVALSAIEDLTPEEEAELMKYIAFLRSRRASP
jgi:HTH-type transcriptional regulator, competence development regulator